MEGVAIPAVEGVPDPRFIPEGPDTKYVCTKVERPAPASLSKLIQCGWSDNRNNFS